MKSTIWKFELESTGMQQIEIPADSKILSVQNQNEKICIWVQVNPNNEKTKRTFEIFGTGHPMPEANRDYLGTFQLHGGQLVFHLFELKSLQVVSGITNT